MNANAYGGDLSRVLEWVEIATPAGAARRAPDELGFSYRRSNLGSARGRGAGVVRALAGRAGGASRRRWPTCARRARPPSPPGSRPSAPPSRTPTTRAPRGAAPACCSTRRAAAASTVGGARFSEKHANFVENMGAGDHRRRDRADGRGPPARARALRGRARARGAVARRGRRLGAVGGRVSTATVARSAADLAAPGRHGWRCGRLSPRLRRRAGRARRSSTAVLAAGYQFWLRDSSLVAVEQVEVTGPDDARTPGRCGRPSTSAGAHDDHPPRRPRGARAARWRAIPVVRALEVEPDFPHGLRVHVIEYEPAAIAVGDSGRVPVAGDGTILRGLKVEGQPADRRRRRAARRRLPAGPHRPGRRGRGRRGAPTVLRVAHSRTCRRDPARATSPQLREGPELIFGRRHPAARRSGRRPRACWPTSRRAGRATSTCASPAAPPSADWPRRTWRPWRPPAAAAGARRPAGHDDPTGIEPTADPPRSPRRYRTTLPAEPTAPAATAPAETAVPHRAGDAGRAPPRRAPRAARCAAPLEPSSTWSRVDANSRPWVEGWRA